MRIFLIIVLLNIIFPILKLLGFIMWAWWLVIFAPYLLILVFTLFVSFCICMLAYLMSRTTTKW